MKYTMNDFISWVNTLPSEDLYNLCKECTFAIDNGYFEEDSRCSKWVTKIAENNSQPKIMFVLDIVYCVSMELMKRVTKAGSFISYLRNEVKL